MPDYQALKRKAYEKIKANGVEVTFSYSTPGTYDPVTGAETGGADHSFNTYIIILPRNLLDIGIKFNEYDSILSGDLFILVSAYEIVKPEPGFTVEINGEDWNLVSVHVTEPGGVAILYQIRIRR